MNRNVNISPDVFATIFSALSSERRRWSDCGDDPSNPVAKLAAIEIAAIDEAFEVLGVQCTFPDGPFPDRPAGG